MSTLAFELALIFSNSFSTLFLQSTNRVEVLWPRVCFSFVNGAHVMVRKGQLRIAVLAGEPYIYDSESRHHS